MSLQSIFERQTTLPKVIVSDNSTAELYAIDLLRRKYDFAYVRQSGRLSMTDHHNACLKLATTPWALLLHDDDELYPNALSKLESVLSQAGDAGVLVGGIQFITEQGVERGVWVPKLEGKFKGEDIVLRLGLDFQLCPPGTVLNLTAFEAVGGFPDANGVSADYPLVLQLAFSHGVIIVPEFIGRYRIGPQQTTDFSTPGRAEATLDLSIRMAQLTKTIGVSPHVSEQLMDYMTWWIFRIVAAGHFDSHPFFVSKMCRKCKSVSSLNGPWRKQIESEFPVLFVWPQWFVMSIFKTRLFIPSPIRRWIKRAIRGFSNT